MAMNDVAIIGGGIAAPILALALKSYGIISTIYESRSQSAIDEGTVTLTPNSLRILDALGIYDSIRHLGGNFEQIRMLNPQGQTISLVYMGGEVFYGYKSIRIPRQALRTVALGKVAKAGIKIHYEHRCSHITGNKSKLDIHFTNGTTVSSNFVVGADGFNSVVRQHVAPESEPPYYTGLLNLGGSFDRAELERLGFKGHIPTSIFGPKNFFALMPETEDHSKVSFLTSFNHEDVGKTGWEKLANDAGRRKAMLVEQYCCVPWPEWLQRAVESLDAKDIKSWPYHLLPTLSTWISPAGNAVVIGDAAHGMPPTGAQGANAAIEDAQSLAWAMSETGSRDDALYKWELHRRERIEKVVKFTMDNHTRLKAQLGPWQQFLRGWVMWAAMRWLVSADALRWLYGYRWESMMDE